MSRISIRYESEHGNYTITAGHDRPFNHYFGSIELDDDESDFPFYATLDDRDADAGGGFNELAQVRARIESKLGGINLPQGFWEAVSMARGNHSQSFPTVKEGD